MATDDAATVPLDIRGRRRRSWSWRLVVGVLASVVVIAAAGLVALWPPLSSVSTASDLTGAQTSGNLAATGAPTTSSRSGRAGGATAPALTDDTGHRLPATALAGIDAVFRALQDGDAAAVGARYRPSDVDASSWAVLEPRIEQRAVRTRLVTAMQQRPSRGEDVDIIYGSSRYFVGFSDDGTLSYIDAEQDTESATTSSTSAGRFPTSPSDPYGCLAADRALYAGLIGYAEHPCESHFQNPEDPSEMQPDTPATRWSFCHLPTRASDPSDVVRARQRYC